MFAAVLMMLMNPALDAQAQGATAVECPMFTVSSSSDETTINFTLLSSGAPDDITFNWSISSGTIVSGQGTPMIIVEAEKGQYVTASVDIGGVAGDCPTFISATDEIRE